MGRAGGGVIASSPRPSDGSAGDVIGLRADIDALRIHDEKNVDYRSKVDGVMHACGHDVHTAITFGALTAIQELQAGGRLPWPVNLRGIFQPAEEIAQGAREMIEVGAMEGVDAILALHVDPRRPLGRIGVRSGVLTAHADEIEVHIDGRGGHAARPHEASDPIAAAAQLVNAIYLFIPRVTDSRDAVVVTIGQLTGGHTANVIPEKVVLRGTIRTLDNDIRAQTFEHVERIAEGIGRTSRTQIQLQQGPSTHSVVNDDRLIHLLRRVICDTLGGEGVQEILRPSMGSEDFAFYLDWAPGAMIRLGCVSDSFGGCSLHTPGFDVDEECIRIGSRVLARAAIHWSDPRRGSASSAGSPAAANA